MQHFRLIHPGLVLAGLTATLAACGGGGISVVSPKADQVFQTDDTVPVQVTFNNVNPLEARFLLNGEDITSDIQIDTTTRKATAQLPATAILDERSQLQIRAGNQTKTVRFYVDRSPPEVVVTGMTPSTNAPHTALTLEGYVSDLSPVPRTGQGQPQLSYGVQADGQVQFFTLDEHNRFRVDVTTVPMGNAEPASLESAPLRFFAADGSGLVSNDIFAPLNRQPAFARAQVTTQAFESTINPAIQETIDGLNIEAMLTARNPLVDVDGVLSDIPGIPAVRIPIPGIEDPNLLGLGFGMKVSLSNLGIGNLAVNVAPVAAAKPTLKTHVDLDDLDLRINNSVSVELPVLPDPSIPFSSTLTNADLRGDIDIRLKIMGNDIQQPKLAVDSVSMDLSIIGGNIDLVSFDGLPWPLDVALDGLAELFIGGLEQFAFELLDGVLLDQIGDAVKDKVVRQVNKELNLLPSAYAVALQNKQFNFALTAADIATSGNGLTVTLSRGDVSATPLAGDNQAEPGWQLHEQDEFPAFSGTTPTEGLPYDVGMSLDRDFLNKTLQQAHLTGIDRFSTEFTGNTVPVVGNQLRNLDFRVQVKPVLAPFLDEPSPSAEPALASLNAREISLTLAYRDRTKNEDFHEAASVRANVRLDLDLDVNANRLQPKLDSDPDIRIQSFTLNAGETRLNENVLQKLVDFVVPKAMPQLVQAIGAIKLPCIKGRSLDLLELAPDDTGHYTLYANVTADEAACPPGPDVAPPPAPSVHVEFVGCDGQTPEFSVDVFGNGKASDEIRLELKQAGGNFRPFNGSSYFGISNQNDVFRAQACNEYGCGTYGSDSTGRQRCGGGGGNPPTQPL